MRVLSGRLTAVLIASLATIILVGILTPTTTLAKDPPGLARFMYALGRAESHGDYAARNESSGAYGKYQIMPASWRAWAGRYLGDPNAKPSPANQEIVATAKVKALYKGLQAWRRVAYWWLTGSSATSGWSPFATRYVTRVMTYYEQAPDKTVAPVPTADRRRRPHPPRRPRSRPKPSRRPGQSSIGSPRRVGRSRTPARGSRRAIPATRVTSSGMRRRQVRRPGSRSPARASSGTAPSARRVARRGSRSTACASRPSTCIAARSTRTRPCSARPGRRAGRHSLVIAVAGTRGRPYVAIDGFTVTD